MVRNKNSKTGHIFIILTIAFLAASSLFSDVFDNQGRIRRLTHSGNNSVHFPCLSDDGHWMLYVQETSTGEDITKSLRIMNVDTGEETELFEDGKWAAPEPYEGLALHLGTKPPMLSGNGQRAVIVLSLDQPENILDHYLAVLNTDGTGSKIFSFPIEALQGKDWEALDFAGNEWERISHYAVNSE